MANESGTWVMYGLPWDDPDCIHTVDEAIAYIKETGFLPLFKNEIPGFSLEEHTAPENWWSGDPESDPWEWRAMIARRGEVAYGKFFDNKAGFISEEWFPYFANYRRDGYDFDALWDDEKASRRQKKIMDLYSEEHVDEEYFSAEVKQLAGFGREGEKGFDSTIANLQMMTYLCVRDFRQRKNKKGQNYGWPVAVYATPEHIFTYDKVTSAYSEDPIESGKRIALRILEMFPNAEAGAVKRMIGIMAGETPERRKPAKKIEYPVNLLTALDLDMAAPLSDDQLAGLEFLVGHLKKKLQEVVVLRYEQGLTYKEIGERTGRSGSRCGTLCRIAVSRLKRLDKMDWIEKGYNGKLEEIRIQVEEERKVFLQEGKIEQADLMLQSPDALNGISGYIAKQLKNAGIISIGALRACLQEDLWTRKVPGIGEQSSRKIVFAMHQAGMIDESFEAFKETVDRDYLQEKYIRFREEAADES